MSNANFADADNPFDFGEQLLAGGVEFADNPEPRCPCVLLLDTSKSMLGDRIQALNDGLMAYRDELLKDPLACQRVETAIVTFGGKAAQVIQDFVTVDSFPPPLLQADGLTLMGEGVNLALDLLETRKAQYKAHGVAYYRPWLFLITDGEPKGEPAEKVEQASQRIKAEEAGKRVVFFAVGVQGANMKKLSEFTTKRLLKLRGLRFVDMFVWLSRSTQQVAHSNPGDQVALPAVNWGNKFS